MYKKLRKNGLWWLDLFLNYLISVIMIFLASKIENFSDYHSRCILTLIILWVSLETILCIKNSAIFVRNTLKVIFHK